MEDAYLIEDYFGDTVHFLPNCSYRYNYYDEEDMVLENIALLFDGPFTIFAAMFAFIGGIYSVKFLKNAGLNRDLTAGMVYFHYFVLSLI